MLPLQGKISRVERLLKMQGQTSRALHPTDEDLKLVRNNWIFALISWRKKEPSKEELQEIWLKESEELKFDYGATRNCFRKMKPMEFDKAFDKYFENE